MPWYIYIFLYYYQNIKVATEPKVGQEEIRMAH